MSEGDKNINKPKRRLVIKEGSEFKIKVEGLEEFKDSFFKDIYDSAAVNAEEIIDNTKKYYSSNEKFKKDKEEANNIIAFVGERGTGKSSAMVSFAEALKHINDKDTNLDELGLEKFKKLKDVSFVNLDIIDPALLDDKESIFEIIIAKMFSKFKEQMENQSDTLEYDDKKRLLKKFQKVYMDLKTINTDRKDMFKESPYSEDIIETLVSLASGSNMRKSFIELVNEFLEMFAGKENDNNSFLVIPIDDLDMNIKHSAEMAEQIRKYLMVPNVIVLMAIKMGQLKDSIEQMYRENYAVMLKEGNLSDDPKEMAERYIEKLIPNGRKLYLPDIRVHKDGIEEGIELVFEDENMNKGLEEFNYVCNNGESMHNCCITKNSNLNEKKESESDLSIEDTVLKMTYEKTGLIFIKNDYDVHYLVPDNLRELQNYLIMINKMDDIKLIPNDDEEDKQIRLHNLEKFETYFLKNWIKKNLSQKHIKILDEFYEKSIKEKNKYIVNSLTDEIFIEFLGGRHALSREEVINKMNDYDKELIRIIINRGNNPLNISIGDVITVVDIFGRYVDRESYKKVKFAIQTMYSILLSKLIFCGNDNQDVTTVIGGSIFGDQALKFLRSNRAIYKIDNYLEIFKIGGKTINYIVINEVEKIKNKILSSENIEKYLKDEQSNNEKVTEIQIIEWLFYFLYFGKVVKDGKERSYDFRYYGILYVICEKNERQQYLYSKFDATAFMFYLLNPDMILYKTFAAYIDDELEINKNSVKDKKFIETNGENSVKKIREYIIDILKRRSNYKEIQEWRKHYKSVIPIYSIEFIEFIIKNIAKVCQYRGKVEGKYNLIFSRFINGIEKCIEEAISKNYFLKIKEKDSEKYYLVDAYIKCPIIDMFKKQQILSSEILNNMQESNEHHKTLKILQDNKNYFLNKIDKNRAKSTLTKRINDMIRQDNNKHFSDEFKKSLGKIKKYKSDDQKISKDILKDVIEAIDKEIKKIKNSEGDS